MANFYAKEHSGEYRFNSKCVARLQKSFEEQVQKPLPKDFKSCLTGPSVVWKIFKYLNLAMTYANTCTKDALVFAFEEKDSCGTGRRLFLVTHPHHMWLNYKQRLPAERCSYEVIQEGFPCKLYFDLEFLIPINPSANGPEMTNIFIKCVIAALKDVYDINSKCSDALWLDSSTDLKYSCHLIFLLSDAAFRNNIQAGVFVSFLLSNIKKIVDGVAVSSNLWPSSTELKKLFIVMKSGDTSVFCDNGVYTKNRNFRLYLSTKHGKNAPLVISTMNKYVPQSGPLENMEDAMFLDSLITFFRRNNQIKRLLDNDAHVPSQVPIQFQQKRSHSNTRSDFDANTSSSPFPYVDNFILSIVLDVQKIGYIRRWTYFEKEQLLLYDIGNFRYCANINRHHKSNNIMIIVELGKKIYYQKCYDPLCRLQGFKSEAHPLPEDIASISYLPQDLECDILFSQLDNSNNKENFSTNVLSESKLDEESNIDCESKDVVTENNLELNLREENEMIQAFENVEEEEFLFSQTLLMSDSKENQTKPNPVSTFPQSQSRLTNSLVNDLPEDFWGEINFSQKEMEKVSEQDEQEMMTAAELAEISFEENFMTNEEETIF